MNEYEKYCLRILLDFAFYANATVIPTTIRKYIDKIMPIFEKDIIFTPGATIKYNLHCDSNKVEYILNLDNYEDYENKLLGDKNFNRFVKYMKKYEAKPKYTVIGPIRKTIDKNGLKKSVDVFQIKANKTFAVHCCGHFALIKNGTPGGYIESEDNLCKDDYSWICKDCFAIENSRVEDNSLISEHAQIYDSVIIKNSYCAGYSDIFDNVFIKNSEILVSTIKDGIEIYNSYLFDCMLTKYLLIKDSELTSLVLNGNYAIKNSQIPGL